MTDAFEQLSYLAASENRIRALEALSDGCRDRDELGARVGASKPTLSRLLRDFEEYGWITATNGALEFTKTGDLLLRDIQRTVDNAETMGRLGELVEWLPVDEPDFPLDGLAEANVERHRRGATFAVLRRLLSTWVEADVVRVVAHLLSADILETQKLAAERGQRSTILVDDHVVSVIESTHEMAPLVSELARTEAVEFVHVEGTFDCSIGLFDDDLTVLAPTDEGHRPAGLVESDDDDVRSWANGRFEEFKRRGTPLNGQEFVDG